MEKGKVKVSKKKQGDTVSNKEETSVDVSNNTPVKRKRGRMQSCKKSNAHVSDIHPTALVLTKSNGESTQPHRGRGRPRLSDTKQTEQQGEVKPKITAVVQRAAAENVRNDGSDVRKRGRPKGTIKRKLESLTSGEEEEGSTVTPRKRGRPKKSLNKEPKLENTVSSERDAKTDGNQNSATREMGRPMKMEVKYTEEASSGITDAPISRRGRPRKCIKQEELVTDGSQPERRGRGRPKGSLNKSRVQDKVGRPLKVPGFPVKGKKRGRPRQQPAKRGRPRKNPLPSPEEVKKPKVWKPLGRPRKYPRVETSEEAPPAPRRSRGRPCKSESRKAVHLRRNARSASSAAHACADGLQRKRGRPASTTKSEGDVPRKRGRPKGSVNKNRARSETQLHSLHSKTESESPAVRVESKAGFDTEMILI